MEEAPSHKLPTRYWNTMPPQLYLLNSPKLLSTTLNNPLCTIPFILGKKNSDKPNNIYNLQTSTTVVESFKRLSNSSYIIVIITRLEPNKLLYWESLDSFSRTRFSPPTLNPIPTQTSSNVKNTNSDLFSKPHFFSTNLQHSSLTNILLICRSPSTMRSQPKGVPFMHALWSSDKMLFTFMRNLVLQQWRTRMHSYI